MTTEYTPTPEGIRELLPRLSALRHRVKETMFREPDAYMLPKVLDPGAYDGEDATDVPAQLMGKPVIWSEDGVVGVVLSA